MQVIQHQQSHRARVLDHKFEKHVQEIHHIGLTIFFRIASSTYDDKNNFHRVDREHRNAE